MALVKVSPCEHGKRLGISLLQEGATFYDPACKDTKGGMRPHVAGKPAKPAARKTTARKATAS